MRDTHTQREQTVREEECAQGYSNTLSRQANRQAVEPRSKSRDPWVTLSLPLSLENHTYATPLFFLFFLYHSDPLSTNKPRPTPLTSSVLAKPTLQRVHNNIIRSPEYHLFVFLGECLRQLLFFQYHIFLLSQAI